MTAVKRHCAIYTRKSTDDRLDMEFNSLDAQREACLAYITSQKSEGWSAVETHYDDGGFSGGTMDRPALARLLEDITAGRLNIVVVYKIDRLTRSLMDFTKLVQAFDQHGVTFVSVTQSFNTTTSMGRLTLNVLLSFAQFEREVAGERIRDKIAASKRKGMWMGGNLPLGYDVKDRHLIVNQAEAETVRHIFRRYLVLGNVRELKLKLEQGGIVGKAGKPIGRGALYTILSNPVYIGRTRHRAASYEGQHEAIVPTDLWDDVQSRVKEQAAIERGIRQASDGNLLRGILFDEAGSPYTPTFAVKGGKRYRYYVSQSGEKKHRLPAHSLEAAIEAGVREHLADAYRDAALFGLDPERDHHLLQTMVSSSAGLSIAGLINAIARIVVKPAELIIEIKLPILATMLIENRPAGLPEIPDTGIITIPFSTQWSAGAIVIQPKTLRYDPLDVDPVKLKRIVQGFAWREQHFAGQPIRHIAEREGLSDAYVGNRIFETFAIV